MDVRPAATVPPGRPLAAAAPAPAGGAKRLVDVAGAGVALLLAATPLGVAALLVRLDLGAPVLFRQTRAGRGGVPFTLAKLRTMTDARGPDGVLLPDAARTTALSRLVRRSRVDELPQLVAVLRGSMALVGPRPLLPETVAGFGRAGVRRGAVRPGLTGLAQVSGNTRLSDREKLALDLWYVAHGSLLADVSIGVQTALVVLFGERRRERRIAAAERHLRAHFPELFR